MSVVFHPLRPGEVISHPVMCAREGISLQRGMNFRVRGNHSIILMSRRKGAPYSDRFEGAGTIVIYEGHDIPRRLGGPRPKSVDQPLQTPGGKSTQNALFQGAAQRFKDGTSPAEIVQVYEKLMRGVWVYNGCFKLVDTWSERSGRRIIFKFRLEMFSQADSPAADRLLEPSQTRVIPSPVKLEVWKRDRGRCVKCGRTDNLHFDHVLPYSKQGTSLLAENIQLLCARHNLQKRDTIE